MKAVRVKRGEWGIQWPDGLVANGFASRDAAEREIARHNEREAETQRQLNLIGVLTDAAKAKRLPWGEFFAAYDAGGREPLEQLAAQYGLLKPGTQGAT